MAGGVLPKASELKAAAARVRLWADEMDGSVIPQADIELVLRHYAKLTKPKVSRKGLYVKGRTYEYEARDAFIEGGLRCRRVPGSGGGEEKGDLRLITGWDEEYKGEAKRYAKIPAYLTESLIDKAHDFTVFREDRGESFVLVRFARFVELCQ